LRSRPFNEGCTNERRGLTDLHLSTVLLTDHRPTFRTNGLGRR
jgi:hypothetical protein